MAMVLHLVDVLLFANRNCNLPHLVHFPSRANKILLAGYHGYPRKVHRVSFSVILGHDIEYQFAMFSKLSPVLLVKFSLSLP